VKYTEIVADHFETPRTLVAVISLICVALAAEPACCCSCAPPGSVEESFAEASAVFVGRVVSRDSFSEFSEDLDFWNPGYAFHFSLDYVWKGDLVDTATVFTGSGGGDCSFPFERGERYVVYAYEYDGRLIANLCSRTTTLEHAAEDLEILGGDVDEAIRRSDSRRRMALLVSGAICGLTLLAIIWVCLKAKPRASVPSGES
jgi:hypothetical protein